MVINNGHSLVELFKDVLHLTKPVRSLDVGVGHAVQRPFGNNVARNMVDWLIGALIRQPCCPWASRYSSIILGKILVRLQRPFVKHATLNPANLRQDSCKCPPGPEVHLIEPQSSPVRR